MIPNLTLFRIRLINSSKIMLSFKKIMEVLEQRTSLLSLNLVKLMSTNNKFHNWVWNWKKLKNNFFRPKTNLCFTKMNSKVQIWKDRNVSSKDKHYKEIIKVKVPNYSKFRASIKLVTSSLDKVKNRFQV